MLVATMTKAGLSDHAGKFCAFQRLKFSALVSVLVSSIARTDHEATIRGRDPALVAAAAHRKMVLTSHRVHHANVAMQPRLAAAAAAEHEAQHFSAQLNQQPQVNQQQQRLAEDATRLEAEAQRRREEVREAERKRQDEVAAQECVFAFAAAAERASDEAKRDEWSAMGVSDLSSAYDYSSSSSSSSSSSVSTDALNKAPTLANAYESQLFLPAPRVHPLPPTALRKLFARLQGETTPLARRNIGPNYRLPVPRVDQGPAAGTDANRQRYVRVESMWARAIEE